MLRCEVERLSAEYDELRGLFAPSMISILVERDPEGAGSQFDPTVVDALLRVIQLAKDEAPTWPRAP